MAASGNLVCAWNDPLLYDVELPLQAAYYPLGFRVNVASNSAHALEAADESWSAYCPEFDRQSLSIRVIVQPEGALADEPPVFRGQGNLYSIVYDRHNFGVYETTGLAGYICVSEKTAADHIRLRLHFLEAMTYSLLAQRYVVPLHAAAVMRGESGFLLCGASGAGKSTLAFACARAGWSFVSDDATWLPVDVNDRIAIGRPSHARFREDAPELFSELAQYAAEQRPNGKITIEAPTADFDHIRTAVRCSADHLVLLDRRDAQPRLTSIPAFEVVERLLADSPSYGPQVRQLYERTLSRLLEAFAWRLEYRTAEEALELLARIQ